jgi:hypothetical protein
VKYAGLELPTEQAISEIFPFSSAINVFALLNLTNLKYLFSDLPVNAFNFLCN